MAPAPFPLESFAPAPTSYQQAANVQLGYGNGVQGSMAHVGVPMMQVPQSQVIGQQQMLQSRMPLPQEHPQVSWCAAGSGAPASMMPQTMSIRPQVQAPPKFWPPAVAHAGTLWMQHELTQEEKDDMSAERQHALQASYVGALLLDPGGDAAYRQRQEQEKRELEQRQEQEKLELEAKQRSEFEAWYAKRYGEAVSSTTVMTQQEEHSEWAVAAKAKKDAVAAAMEKKAEGIQYAGPDYDYGERQVWYSEWLPVVEGNGGVVVNAEFCTPSQAAAREAYCLDDEAIRNRDWWIMGQWMHRRAAPASATAGPSGAFAANGGDNGESGFNEPFAPQNDDSSGGGRARGVQLDAGCDYSTAIDPAAGCGGMGYGLGSNSGCGNGAQAVPQRALPASAIERAERVARAEICSAADIETFFASQHRVMYETLLRPSEGTGM
eukprot:TRINITY_DN26184_c0_g1_i1.p1 TRINITY_DN26184_c0_g1~~TRINITY_DN26184_c0_g1_i1.p1  ORF type:complete len:436 (+),score=73.01 TRINITY_DN26184_c0_g1_i1:54-1361(+)